MAKEEAQRVDGASAVERGLGVLERAWDMQWALRLTCVVLFLDMALMLRAGKGLVQWSPGDETLLSDVGWIALLIVAFSFAVAIVIPVILTVLLQIARIAWGWLPTFRTAQDNRPYQRPLGYAPARTFHDLALHERDDFLIRLYQEHERARVAEGQSRAKAGELTAAALLVAFADWMLVQWVPGSASLIGAVIEKLGDWASIIVPIVLLCAGSILKWAWFSDTWPNLIYYPPLDRELRDKERKERGAD